MKLTLQRSVRWVPPFNGNETLPEAEQITVEIKVPTAAEWAAIVHRPSTAPLPATDMLTRLVPEVRNLTVEDQGKTRAIETGAELAEAPGLGRLANLVLLKVLGLGGVPDPT